MTGAIDRAAAFIGRRAGAIVVLGAISAVAALAYTIENLGLAGEEGAVLLDFTTELGDSDFGMLAIDEKPLDAFHGIHEAHWKEPGW